jgi:hypothetical protein
MSPQVYEKVQNNILLELELKKKKAVVDSPYWFLEILST